MSHSAAAYQGSMIAPTPARMGGGDLSPPRRHRLSQSLPTESILLVHGLDDLLTIDQAAEVLNVTASTLNGWRWNGTGPTYVRVGKVVRYQRAALREYISANTHVSVIAAMRAKTMPENREERLARLRSQRASRDQINRKLDIARARGPKRTTTAKVLQQPE